MINNKLNLTCSYVVASVIMWIHTTIDVHGEVKRVWIQDEKKNKH